MKKVIFNLLITASTMLHTAIF